MSSLLNRGATGGSPHGQDPFQHSSDSTAIPMLGAAVAPGGGGGGREDGHAIGNNSNKVKPFGNTKLCCFDKCVWAEDSTSAVVITIVLLAFTGLFTYVWILDSGLRWLCYIDYLLMFFVLVAMWEAVTTDPGIIPKQTDKPSNRPANNQIEFLELRGVKIFLPYCPTCNIIRPPRASHCNACNNCVDKFDHHCGVIGACVGRGNFKFFFIFLVTIVIYAWFNVAVMIYFLVGHWSASSTNDVKKAFAVITTIIGTIVGLQVGAMMIHYIRLIALGRTQRENVKKDRIYSPPGSNPYDDGCVVNYYETCCL